MSSPKKIGRWNRFEIAFNEGNWPKPSFSSSSPSRASEKTRGLRKMEKTPSGPTTAPPKETPRERSETPGKVSPEEKTPPVNAALPEKASSEPSPEEKTPLNNAAPSEETPLLSVASSPTLWAEARQRAPKAKKSRF